MPDSFAPLTYEEAYEILGGPRRFSPEDLTITGGRRRLTGLKRDLGELGAEFRSEAGPQRTFGAEERETLEFGDLEAARRLLGGEYEGPAGLAQEGVVRLGEDLSQLGGYFGALSRGEGLGAYYGVTRPGLSRGEAEFEARGTYRDLMGGGRELLGETRSLLSALEREDVAAREIAERRRGEAETVRQRSRQHVERLEGQVEEVLSGRLAAEREQQRAVAEAYREFGETGLLGAVEQHLTREERRGFETAQRGRLEAGRAQLEPILEEFRDVRGYEVDLQLDGSDLRYRVTDRDGNTYRLKDLVQGSGDEPHILPGLTREQSMRVGRRILERQQALEPFFAPTFPGVDWRGEEGDPHLRTTFGGPYHAAHPLYMESRYVEPDLAQFLSYDPVELGLGHVGSEAEIARLNRYRTLLEDPNLVTAEALPDYFRADTEGFREAEREAVEEYNRQLREETQARFRAREAALRSQRESEDLSFIEEIHQPWNIDYG